MKQKISIPLNITDFHGELADVFQHIQVLINTYGPEATLDFDTESGYYESHNVVVSVYRMETDEEGKERLAKQVEYRKLAEQRERAEYERLRKVFEK